MPIYILLPAGADGGLILSLALCFLLYVFFSFSESALIFADRRKLEELAQKKNRAAGIAAGLLRCPAALHTGLLICRSFLLVSAVALTQLYVLLRCGFTAMAAALPAVFLVICFVETAAESFAVRRFFRLALVSALPLRILTALLSPLIRLLLLAAGGGFRKEAAGSSAPPSVSGEKLWGRDGAREDMIASSERQMIEGVFEISGTVAGDIMVPRVEMATVDSSSSVADLIRVVNETGHSRIPVRSGSVDNIIGVVYAKDVLKWVGGDRGVQEIGVERIMRSCHFAPESQNVVVLLAELKEKKSSVAVIIDEFGGTAGMVSIENIVEEIVGDIDDEFDSSLPLYEKRDGLYILDAKMSVYDVGELLGIDFPEGDYKSIGGYVISLIENIPSPGDCVHCGGYRFVVRETEESRLTRIEVHIPGGEKTVS